nr:COL2 [Tamarix hispida]
MTIESPSHNIEITHNQPSTPGKKNRKPETSEMLKEELSDGGRHDGGNNWARVCDTCRSAPCTVYCQADSAYLCTDCDARIHAATQTASTHERVLVCEACERMPAAFLCKADAASLCVSCDADIHSANPLANRHHRVPIHPIVGGIYGQPGTDGAGRLPEQMGYGTDSFLAPKGDECFSKEDEDEAASWLLLNPSVKNSNNHHNSNVNMFGGDVDDYLDLDEYNSGIDSQFSEQHSQQQQYAMPHKSYGGDDDSAVPVQSAETKYQVQQQQQQPHNFRIGMGYQTNAAYSYIASISRSESVSSPDVSLVQESTTSDIKMPHSRTPNGTVDFFSSPPLQTPTQLAPVDREARVLRYREKKKSRKFEKKIRYASRKAYAETRPRIKGRFAKRSDVEVEVEQRLPNNLIGEGGYGGIVPSECWKCNEDSVITCQK